MDGKDTGFPFQWRKACLGNTRPFVCLDGDLGRDVSLGFLKGAREGWPIIGSLVRLVVKDEFAQRDRYVKENIEVLAKRLGEMQAKMLQLESLGERVSGLAGINPADIKMKPGQGGVLVSGRDLTMDELDAALNELDALTGQRTDVMTVIESRLFEQKIKK